MYEGRVAEVAHPQMVMGRDLVSEPLARGLQQVAANVGGMLRVGAAYEDGKHEFEGELALMDIKRSAAAEVTSRLQLADGAEGSFFDAAGNLKQVEVANFEAKVNKRLASVGAGMLNGERRQALQQRAGLLGAKLLDELAGVWTKVQAEKCGVAWRGAFDRAMAEKDYVTAARLMDAGVGAGVHGRGGARRGKRGVAGAALGAALEGGRAIDVNGRRYTGASRALAVAAAAEGGKPKPEGGGESQGHEGVEPEEGGGVYAGDGRVPGDVRGAIGGGEGRTLTMRPYAADVELEDAAVTVGGGVQQGEEGGLEAREDEVLTLRGVQERVPEVDVDDDKVWFDFERGDYGGLARVADMEGVEWREPLVALSGGGAEEDTGSEQFEAKEREFESARLEAGAGAPAAVGRVVAGANARGGVLGKGDAEQIVVAVAMEAGAAYDGASDADVLKVFEGAGVFEALGEGDAAYGKVVASGLVAEWRERGKQGTTKVNLTTIRRLVKERVAREDFNAAGEGWGWHGMEKLNPGVPKGEKLSDVWDKERAHEVWKKWYDLRAKYQWYRKQGRFVPGAGEEVPTDEEGWEEEFDKHAQAFYNWYMKEEYGGYRKRCQEAAEEWYMAQVMKRLAEGVQYGEGGAQVADGKGGYVQEMQMVADVLRERPPVDLGVEAQAAEAAEAERRTKARVGTLRRMAGEKRKQLADARTRVQAAEAERKAEAKRAEEERKAEAKRAEVKRRHELNVKRGKMQDSAWSWDGTNAMDGEVPGVSLPKAELDRLLGECEYDEGAQDVYVMVGNVKCVVVGVHEGEGLRLNTAAVYKVNGRLKKGQRPRVRGKVRWGYKFTNKR